jgi:hypothetical protein
MFAPYYLCPIMWSYAVPERYVPRIFPLRYEDDEILLAWYYMMELEYVN